MAKRAAAKPRRTHSFMKLVAILAIAVVLAGATAYALKNYHSNKPKPTHTVQQTKSTAKNTPTPAKPSTNTNATPDNTVATPPNPCAGNTLSQLALVSISQRHMWACEGTVVAYSSPVVTGMEFLAADLTPVGTYHIYSKQTNLYLKGSDSTGSWNDYVYYWMPWLSNQYGIYGFHDATWRSADAFGNISPDSSDASHGCVELPLDTAKWLYNWAQIGTTVQVES